MTFVCLSYRHCSRGGVRRGGRAYSVHEKRAQKLRKGLAALQTAATLAWDGDRSNGRVQASTRPTTRAPKKGPCRLGRAERIGGAPSQGRKNRTAPSVERGIHRVRLARLKDEMKERETKARQAFKDAWVKSTETELFQCVRKLNTGMALDTTAFNDYMGLLSHKLMTHHANTGTKMCETAVAERRRACVRWGFINDKFAHLITNLSDPVPWCTEEGECVESFTFRLRCLSKQIVFFFSIIQNTRRAPRMKAVR